MAKGKTVFSALLLSLSLLLTGCGAQTEGADTQESAEGTATVGEAVRYTAAADSVFSVDYDPNKSLNPLKADSSINLQLWSLLYDQVYKVENDFSFSSEVVTACTTTDNIWWTFNVDTTIPFSDGSTLTAQDVAYSIRLAQQNSYYAKRLSVIYGVSAMSEDCFAITTKYADSLLPALLNIPIIKYGTGNDAVPVGSGPYMLAEEGDRLVAFEGNRHAAEMPIDTIYLKTYSDMSEKISAFEDSRLDIVTNDPSGMYNLGYGSSNETRYFDTTNMHYIGFNMAGSFFQSPLARYALAYAIDRKEIVGEYLGGAAVASTLPVLPTSALYDADYAGKFSYDMDKCASLFESANVKDHDDDGKPEFLVTGIVVEIDIDFIVNIESTGKLLAARRLAEDLNSIGITTTLRELNWEDYMEALETGDYDMYYGEIRLSADWNLAELFEEENSMNYAKCTDPNFSALYYTYLAANEAGRYNAYQDACRYLTENAGIIPICFERRQVLTHRNVVNGLAPTQYDLFNDFTEWTIDLK